MIVVCNARTRKIVKRVPCVIPEELPARYDELGAAFAIIPPLPPELECDLANYVARRGATAFVLHKGPRELDLVRLVFGEEISLRRAAFPGAPRSAIPTLQRYLEKRSVEHTIEWSEPDSSAFPSTDADDESVEGSRASTACERTPLEPLATLGASADVCAASARIGTGRAVLLPLGKGFDAEDAKLLEEMASPPPRKVLIRVGIEDLKSGEATLQVDDHDPETRSSQRPMILAAFRRDRSRTLNDIGLAMETPASLLRERPVGQPGLSPTEIGNRIDKLNKHFRDRYGLDFNVVLGPPGKPGTRALNKRVTLEVEGLPD